MPSLTAIGVGPGDPDLLTVKAVRAIQNADIIMCPASGEDRPSIAFSIISQLIDKSEDQEVVKLIFPMTKDRDVLEQTWKRNAKIMAERAMSGKNVVYITVGDPYLYSTWIYMHRDLAANHPDIDITVIPGIVSIFTFASKVGVSIAEGAEKVAIIPSCYDLSSVREIARSAETMVFLKDGRYFDQVIDVLRESGFPGGFDICNRTGSWNRQGDRQKNDARRGKRPRPDNQVLLNTGGKACLTSSLWGAGREIPSSLQ